MKRSWHTKPLADVIEELDSRESGLSVEEAKERLKTYGPNRLPEGKADTFFIVFVRQFQSSLIYVLLGAAAIVFALGEVVDGVIILIVLFANAIIGAIQEGRAQDTLRALKKYTETTTTVIRDGKEVIVPDAEVVPGDMIILQEGERVGADARIVFANTLKLDEASLTGESEPVAKSALVLSNEHLAVAERKNMVFKGTRVLSGSGVALVVATGVSTEIGTIATKIATIDTEIPLKANIRYLSHITIAAVLLLSASIIVFGVLTGKGLVEMFTTAVALSISVIPEGLPIVLTLVLATGVWRMSKHNVLVKKLQAVETLGQAQIIAVDKTGTLTRNEMLLERVYVDESLFEIRGNGYDPKGEILLHGNIVDPLNHPELLLCGKIAAYSANARLSYDEAARSWRVAGDPTEAAMRVFSEKIGFHRKALDQEAPIVFESPFDYKRKYHVVIRSMDGRNTLVMVGAPEKLLKLCERVWHKGRTEEISKRKREELEAAFMGFAREGYRVVACAIHSESQKTFDPSSVPPLTFVGFFCIKDALRAEVKDTVSRVEAAGIRVVMITGDHQLTAEAIAREAGIRLTDGSLLTGEDIEVMSDEEFAERLPHVSVFARVTPEHKLRIIQAYRKRGEVVAMTGDGVNDAPSLVAADLGVSMGTIGTEVAKEASDIVLLDDNFGNIVSAAEEGRSMYKTIRKVILYLFSTNVGEIFTIVGALALGYALPLLPAQIIWLNFVTDGFFDVALAMEPKEKGLLQGKFERPKKFIIDWFMAKRMVLMALTMAVGTLTLFSFALEDGLVKAWTVSLTTLAVFQWFNAWNCRSEYKSIFHMNPFSNTFLVIATIAIIPFHLAALYVPFLQKVLHTQPLSFEEWAVIVVVAASIVVVEELRKFFVRRAAPTPEPASAF